MNKTNYWNILSKTETRADFHLKKVKILCKLCDKDLFFFPTSLEDQSHQKSLITLPENVYLKCFEKLAVVKKLKFTHQGNYI